MVSSHSNNAAQMNQENYVFVTLPASTVAPEVLVTPPALIAAAPELHAPGRENTPAVVTAPSSSPSVSCTPVVVCGALTLSDLDAITVNKLLYRVSLHLLLLWHLSN